MFSCPAVGLNIAARRGEPPRPRSRPRPRGSGRDRREGGGSGGGEAEGLPVAFPSRRPGTVTRPPACAEGLPAPCTCVPQCGARWSTPPLVAGPRPPTWPRPQPWPRRSLGCPRKKGPALQATSLKSKMATPCASRTSAEAARPVGGAATEAGGGARNWKG